MSSKLLVATWLWNQIPRRHDFSADKVNKWAAMMRRHLTIDHDIACVTNIPEGLDPSIIHIPAPTEFDDIKIDSWDEKRKMPQCYRRLAIFAPDAAERFGAERIVSMDCDVTVHGNIDSLFDHDYDFCALRGRDGKRAYNGGMVQIKAGSRPQVYTEFTPEGAALSRKKTVGSDQAWMSYILGKGEKTWDTSHGIYYYVQGRFKGPNQERYTTPPKDIRVLFYPGSPKPWEPSAQKNKFIENAWNGADAKIELGLMGRATRKDASSAPLQEGLPPRVPSTQPPPTIQAYYGGRKKRGLLFQEAAKRQGLACSVFRNVEQATDAPCYVAMDHAREERATSKQVVADLHRRGVVTLPTYQESLLYDDKGAQLPVLERWMPETWLLTNVVQATELAHGLAWPILSKTVEGAGSYNVRLLRSLGDAIQELQQVFGPHGLPTRYDRRQQGYVYWQRLVKGNDHDYRVVVAGDYVYGLVRKNAPGTVMASGSGVNYPIAMKDSRETMACKMALEIADALNTRWMAFDIVFEEDKRMGAVLYKPYALEMSSMWTPQPYAACKLFTRELRETEKTGASQFELALDVLLKLVENSGEEAA